MHSNAQRLIVNWFLMVVVCYVQSACKKLSPFVFGSAHLIKLIQSCAFQAWRPHYLCLPGAWHIMTPLSLSPCYTCCQQGVQLTP